MFALVPAIGSVLLAANVNASPCMHSEPTVVNLSGILERATFPGPPNYEGISDGDAPETYFVLKLGSGICLTPDPEQVSERIQLVFLKDPAQSYSALAPAVGKEVSCSGSLFASQSGHHHTPILLTVTNCAASN